MPLKDTDLSLGDSHLKLHHFARRLFSTLWLWPRDILNHTFYHIFYLPILNNNA